MLTFAPAIFALLLPLGSLVLAPVVSAPKEHASVIALAMPRDTTAVDRAADASQMFAHVNEKRTAMGLPPLQFDPQLARVAAAHARDMVERRYFGHETPEGVSPFDRMRRAGVSFGYAGENIAMNADEPSASTAFWHSDEHRANILQRHYAKVGIAAVRTEGGYGEIFVQEFSD